jgi:hypothetical protein
MQPVTVAISSTGIQYLLKSLLGDQIAKALESNLGAPNYSFQPGNFNFLPGGSSIENDYSNISINISGGQIQTFSPVFSGCVQGPDDNSQFKITMTVSNLAVDYPGGWHESYDYQAYTWNKGGMKVKAYSDQNGHHNNTYDYSVQLPTLTIHVTFQLAASSGGYELTYANGSADAGNPQPNIPGGSILNQQQSEACGYSSHIAAATAQQIGTMNWSGALASALNPIFASIGESGQLGPVTFDFLAPGDTPLVFPSGGGIQIGAKGSVSVNGSAYPGPPPADLPFPPIPAPDPKTGIAPHATYFIQDYEVNALFWGFFLAGVLKATLAHGDLTYPQALMTETYRGGSLNILAVKYPKSFMTAELTALEAPTVSFATIYQFTNDNLAKVQQDVGGANTQYGQDIANLNPGIYSSQAGLEQALQTQDSGLMTYAAAIEEDIAVPGVVVNHMVRCVLNVLWKEQTLPVITFDVPQTFVMQDLQLGVANTQNFIVRPIPPILTAPPTQSVIFTFIQPEDVFPQPKFVSSTLPGVNNADFVDAWNALAPNWQNAFSAIGKAGLPLPRIPGFDFIFDQAAITVKPAVAGADGYISITTNVTYSPQTLAPAVRQMLAQQNPLRAA